MALLSICIGIIAGGMLFQFAGAVSGGIIGWFYYSLHLLHTRQNEQQQELAWLRSRLSAHLRDDPDLTRPEPDQAPKPEPAVIVTPAPLVRPMPTQPAWQQEQPAPKTTVDLTAKTEPAYTFKYTPAPETSAEPSALENVLKTIFNGENLLVKLGVLILFCGIAFLVKYAAQHGMFPLELRLLSAAAGGVVLLATGWQLRTKRAEYALALQGGGIGILYLVSYAAFRLYALIPAVPSFALLVAISGLCATLALLQESRTMALFGIIGGFAAPFLASVGIGDPAVLFGYYTVLNIVVIGIAWFRSWRSINLTGFIATFLLSAIWGANYYKPAYFSSVEPFLILFFLIYLGVALLFSLRQPPDLRGISDATLVFGTPLAGFALQSALVSDYRYGMAWSALVAGLCYLACCRLLWKRDQQLRPLAESFLALAGILLSLSIPLAFDGRWTSAAWALEGATMVWLGFRTERRLVRASGYLLQLLSGLAFVIAMDRSAGPLALLNSLYLGCLLLSLSGLYSAFLLYRNNQQRQEWEQPLEYLLIAWGLCWWSGGALYELDRHLQKEFLDGAQLLCAALSALLIRLSARKLQWQNFSWTSLILVVLMPAAAVAWFPAHPLAHGGWFAWPVAFSTSWWLLYSHDQLLPATFKPYPHALLAWLLALVGSLELGWQVRFAMLQQGSWLEISQVVMPVSLLGLLVIGNRTGLWPFRQERTTYLGIIALPLAVWSLGWVVVSSLTCVGDSSPLPWLPLLNQFDLTILAAIAMPLIWLRSLYAEHEFQALLHELQPSITALFSAVAFVWLNSILARSLHYWGEVPFTAHGMLHSPLAQASFSICWSLLALLATLYAVRHAHRRIWICGAALLGVVVAKLFMVDLAGHGTVARIVSFVAVGLLLLVIGWFAPVPPKKE
ncbi:DUF2339 domain-containing protein [Trichlorobacter lovleyi]|uniref:DUF2339 domain-containing protein n=1 Tax=Trichlorobacter lovleyi TaxID=313985 RepID=UPI00223F69EA|nr:DUF2339 domain-containing protein [Trichlorobacter lovleyi]QOX78241.1 DUF2339 domain-containing protein [Trichlorobacter lovleyi]